MEHTKSDKLRRVITIDSESQKHRSLQMKTNDIHSILNTVINFET